MKKKSFGKIIVISGPSGAGKTTLYSRVLDELKDRLSFSISATTRKPRPNEKNGVDYYFMTNEEFMQHKAAGEFIETAEVHGYLYGTLRSEIERILNEGKGCLLDVDVNGAMYIKKEYPDALLIFISPSSFDELKQRLNSRNTDDEETRQLRMSNALIEMKSISKYDVQIINDQLELATRKLRKVIENYLDGIPYRDDEL